MLFQNMDELSNIQNLHLTSEQDPVLNFGGADGQTCLASNGATDIVGWSAAFTFRNAVIWGECNCYWNKNGNCYRDDGDPLLFSGSIHVDKVATLGHFSREMHLWAMSTSSLLQYLM